MSQTSTNVREERCNFVAHAMLLLFIFFR